MKKKATKPYCLLGIDPGTNVLGYAVLGVVGKQIRAIEIGVAKMNHLDTHTEKLGHIYKRIGTLIELHRPKEMAIEAPFFGKNVQSMLKLGRAQGVAMAAAINSDIPVTEYAPRKIKQAVTGKGNASKEQVAAMLETILHTKLDGHYLDATDALGVAVCHYYAMSSPLAGVQRYGGWADFLKANPGRSK